MNLTVEKTGVPLQVLATATFDAADGGDQPFRIDWGDGSGIQSLATGMTGATHTYPKAANYHVVAQANGSRCRAAVTLATPPGSTYDPTRVERRGDQAAGAMAVTGRLGS
jgi:hypothetical protein